MKRIYFLCLVLFYSFAAQTQMIYFKAILQGSQEVPANASTAGGVVIVSYNMVTNNLELTGDYQNLTAAASASHIHSPAAVGVNAPVLFNLTNTGGTTGTLSGTATLTAPQEADLLDTLMYVNVHNATFTGGEIRGQLISTSATTNYFTSQLSGAQEVPANASTATGNVTVLLDNATNEVFLTGNFNGLAANASMGHIHRGAAGTNGPVIVNLLPTLNTAGTIHGNATVSTTFADSMIAGLTYVNIHNGTFPGGEIRAQLNNTVLPVTLTSFDGYRQKDKIALMWESAQELNFKQYEIEQQSEEAGKWINKAVVTAKGGNIIARYSFLDDPVIGNNDYIVYRLKMTDIDGKFSYSPLLKIDFLKSKAQLSIATNPVFNGQLKYSITGLPTNKKAEVLIVNFDGRLVVKTTATLLRNNTINVSNLSAGTYRLIVRVDENVFQQSFIK